MKVRFKQASEDAKNILSNERGSLTVDYLFAFVLVMGLGGIFFALSLTLTMIQVTQYATFAAARVYMAGHGTHDQQQSLATQKFAQLTTGNRIFGPIFSNGWFEVGGGEGIARDYRSTFQNDFGVNDSADASLERSPLLGVRVSFSAKMLDLKIPFFGSTTYGDDPDGGFTTYINSYLSREPSMAECLGFNQRRWESIKQLHSDYQGASGNNPTPTSDNGC